MIIPLLLGVAFLVLVERKVVTSTDVKVLDILKTNMYLLWEKMDVGLGTNYIGSLQSFSFSCYGFLTNFIKEKQPCGQYYCIIFYLWITMLQMCEDNNHLLIWMVMDILH